MRIFIILFIVGLKLNFGISQNFITIQDASGLNLSSTEVDELELLTSEIIADLPDSVQGDFKVYDLGIYRLNNYYSDEIISKVNKFELEIEEPYYILLWFIIDEEGNVQLNMKYAFPDSDYFECFDEDKERQFKERSDLLRISNMKSLRFEQEKALLSYIRSFVINLSGCCVREECNLCDLYPNDIKLLMEYYEATDFNLSSVLTSVEVVDPDSRITYYSGNPEIVFLTVEGTTPVYELVKQYLSFEGFSLGETVAYITTDSNLCDINVSQILSDTSSMYFIWVHVSSTFDKLWVFTVDNVLDEIVFSGCGTRQQSYGMNAPCINAYFLVNAPFRNSIDKEIIRQWIDEIFLRNGLGNISSNVTNNDSEFRVWLDVWIETKNYYTGRIAITDISTMIGNWKFYKHYYIKYPGGKYETFGGTYINVARIEGFPGQGSGILSPTDRHQVYAIISAHEYGHQLFYQAKYFYTEILGLPSFDYRTGKEMHGEGLMMDAESMMKEWSGEVDYINSSNQKYIKFDDKDLLYLKKYFYYRKRYQDILEMHLPSSPFFNFELYSFVNDVKGFVSKY